MSTDETEEPPLKMIGTGMAIVQAGAVGAAAYVLFENPAFAAAVAVMMGIGSALFVPYIILLNAGGEEPLPSDAMPALGSVHVGALGFALDSAAIVALAAAFVVGAGAIPIAAALVYAAGSFAVTRFVLPLPGDELGGDAQVQ